MTMLWIRLSRVWLKYRVPGYNMPDHFAMFLSQWAHHHFMENRYSYERYVKLQNLAYKLFHRDTIRNDGE